MLEIDNSDREYGHGSEVRNVSKTTSSFNENARQQSRINTEDSTKSSTLRPLSFLVLWNFVRIQSEQVTLFKESIE